MPLIQNDPKVLIALDFPDAESTLRFIKPLTPQLCRLKIGKELFTATGPALIEILAERGFDVFLDLKFHDIPNTVASACQVAARLGVWMVNVHALGGRKMLETTREALDKLSHKPLLIGVTVLTSMDADQLAEIGLQADPAAMVARLARLTKDCGLDGVVCSAQEAAQLKQLCGAEFKLVTPGIRPSGAALDDQARIMTPVEAVRAGADYLVIGRPITRSADPLATLLQINAELAAV